MEQKTLKNMFRKIDMKLIDRPDDIVRLDIDQGELRELADSIQERGLMQPIGVTPRGDRFLIVFGDRRYLAHELLGLKKIMCRVEKIEDDKVIIDRAVENIQRVNLTAFEEGHIYAGLVEKAGFSVEAIAGMTGKSAGIIQRRMDILRMPESFQKAIHTGHVSLSVAEELWSCRDKARREYFIDLAIEHGITKAVARNWVDEFKKSERGKKVAGDEGGGALPVFEDTPIFRACDICRGPIEYKDVRELRICEGCHESILEAVKGAKK
ncbi:Nucleoid occlusion protein [subsurface metagenome]